MNYLIGFIIFAGGLSILVDTASPINIFGVAINSFKI
jgi:putative NADH dehydrogenase subunit 6